MKGPLKWPSIIFAMALLVYVLFMVEIPFPWNDEGVLALPGDLSSQPGYFGFLAFIAFGAILTWLYHFLTRNKN